MLFVSTGTEPVGNETDARQALTGGLTYLSRGLFKSVYADADRTTVYKVARLHTCSYTSPQLAAEAAMSAKGIKEGTPGIPPVSVYMIDGTPVLAMPLYDGQAPAYGTPERHAINTYKAEWSRLGIIDMHDDNYTWTADGTPIVIDLGAYGRLPGDTAPDILAIAAAEETTDDDDSYGCESCDGDDGDPDLADYDGGGCHSECCHTDGNCLAVEDPTPAPTHRDLCGLAERMQRGLAPRWNPIVGPTCGHPSRHPSRVVKTRWDGRNCFNQLNMPWYNAIWEIR
jgi:hypothetical protein